MPRRGGRGQDAAAGRRARPVADRPSSTAEETSAGTVPSTSATARSPQHHADLQARTGPSRTKRPAEGQEQHVPKAFSAETLPICGTQAEPA